MTEEVEWREDQGGRPYNNETGKQRRAYKGRKKQVGAYRETEQTLDNNATYQSPWVPVSVQGKQTKSLPMMKQHAFSLFF